MDNIFKTGDVDPAAIGPTTTSSEHLTTTFLPEAGFAGERGSHFSTEGAVASFSSGEMDDAVHNEVLTTAHTFFNRLNSELDVDGGFNHTDDVRNTVLGNLDALEREEPSALGAGLGEVQVGNEDFVVAYRTRNGGSVVKLHTDAEGEEKFSIVIDEEANGDDGRVALVSKNDAQYAVFFASPGSIQRGSNVDDTEYVLNHPSGTFFSTDKDDRSSLEDLASCFHEANFSGSNVPVSAVDAESVSSKTKRAVRKIRDTAGELPLLASMQIHERSQRFRGKGMLIGAAVGVVGAVGLGYLAAKGLDGGSADGIQASTVDVDLADGGITGIETSTGTEEASSISTTTSAAPAEQTESIRSNSTEPTITDNTTPASAEPETLGYDDLETGPSTPSSSQVAQSSGLEADSLVEIGDQIDNANETVSGPGFIEPNGTEPVITPAGSPNTGADGMAIIPLPVESLDAEMSTLSIDCIRPELENVWQDNFSTAEMRMTDETANDIQRVLNGRYREWFEASDLFGEGPTIDGVDGADRGDWRLNVENLTATDGRYTIDIPAEILQDVENLAQDPEALESALEKLNEKAETIEVGGEKIDLQSDLNETNSVDTSQETGHIELENIIQHTNGSESQPHTLTDGQAFRTLKEIELTYPDLIQDMIEEDLLYRDPEVGDLRISSPAARTYMPEQMIQLIEERASNPDGILSENAVKALEPLTQAMNNVLPESAEALTTSEIFEQLNARAKDAGIDRSDFITYVEANFDTYFGENGRYSGRSPRTFLNSPQIAAEVSRDYTSWLEQQNNAAAASQ